MAPASVLVAIATGREKPIISQKGVEIMLDPPPHIELISVDPKATDTMAENWAASIKALTYLAILSIPAIIAPKRLVGEPRESSPTE